MINSKTITRLLTSKQKVPEKAKALVDAANNAGGKDNVTVVLLHNTNQRVAVEATKPAIIKKNESQTGNDDADPQENGVQLSKPKNNRVLITILVLLCLGLLAALLWQLSQSKKERVIETTTPDIPKNDSELKLQETLRGSSIIVLNDSLYGQTLLISDTIFIDKDSVHINGNNLVLQSRDKEKSAAFMITPTSRYVLFENIVFKNFEKAIITGSGVVQLKNVRFQDCDVAVEQDYRFPQNNPVYGGTIDTILFKADSVAN
jgi:hypothetical protein